MENSLPCFIRFAHSDEWEEAMSLVWRTFLVFEAPVYLPQGIRSFENFITDSTLKRMFEMGVYQMLVAIYEGKVVGMITLRDKAHISLLFVDEDYHFMGVGKALVAHLCRYLRDEAGERRVTVNASPYGVDFYHRIGFTDLGAEALSDGIRYTPMEIRF
ncbi:MAG: GNAT family N-acetyltransferase [Lachnospiraceae bacterium]|nr:GNAT family N-acetyltransferase [Lachnospiraceae bacterium]